jgi:hypothetical protein
LSGCATGSFSRRAQLHGVSLVSYIQPALLGFVNRTFIAAFADIFTTLQSHAGLHLIIFTPDFTNDDPP